MIKFDKPIQTKSGLDIDEVWIELQKCWTEYKKAKFNHDFEPMRNYALRIQQLQNDIGLKQAQFQELTDPPLHPN